MKTQHVIANGILFQGLWFSCVLLKLEWALCFFAIMLIHGIKYLMTKESAWLVLGAFALGLLMDGTLSLLGVYSFPDGAWASIFSFNTEGFIFPMWLLIIWLGFSLAVPHSMAWLLKYKFIFVLSMATLAPVSYMLGKNFGVIEFLNQDLLLMSLLWACWASLLLLMQTKLHKVFKFQGSDSHTRVESNA